MNTTRQNRIRLDIYSLAHPYQSYTVHDGLGTVFTEDLTSCYITFPCNELEIFMNRYTIRFGIRTEATNPDSHDSSITTPTVTDCEGLVHFDAEKEPDINVDYICSDSWCPKNDIITEIGELLTVDISWCGPCTLTVNTTRQNRIRLDIDNIYSLAQSYPSYTVHDGVGTVFTEDLSSCHIIFPSNELEISMDWDTVFRISTEATNTDSHDSSITTPTVTDCEGLVHFDAEKEPDINVDYICSDSWCTKNDIITEIGELLAVDTSWCGPCTLTVNVPRQNKIRLDIDNIDSLSQFYITYDGIGTRFTQESWFTGDLTSCSITFPTNALAIHSNINAFYRISTESSNQVSHSNTTIVTDCSEGIVHFEAVDFNIDCSDPTCTRSEIITENGETLQVDTDLWCETCRLSVNTRRNRLRLDIGYLGFESFIAQFYIIYDGKGTGFTASSSPCTITFPSNELDIYFNVINADFTIRTNATNEDAYDTNNTIHTDCVGFIHLDNAEIVKYVETEVNIESSYTEIRRYVTSVNSREVKGVLPICPFNCSCRLYYQYFQQLIAHCSNKTSITLLLHNSEPSNPLLSTLDASNRWLESMDAIAFQGLSVIERLVLNKNLLTHIEPGTFTPLTALAILEIANNMITDLESSIFREISPLQILDLHGNQLTSTSLPVLQLDTTLVLDLSENNLDTFISGTFESPPDLNILILDKNNITTLHPNTNHNLLSLQILFLDDNRLTTIAPNMFPNGLLKLHLSGNQVSEIVSNIFQAEQFQGVKSQLQELTVSQNSITSIPQDVFCYTPNLQQLSIANNQLRHFDLKPLASLKQLKVLNISGNIVEFVLHGLPQGNQWNFCNSTDNGSITHLLPNLQQVDLNNNEIQMIEGNLFQEMPIIDTISLRGNPLRMIDKQTFASLKFDTIVFVDEPATCCFIEKSQCKPQKEEPPYLTCLRLLPYPSVRVCMWLFGLFALLGNLSVLIWRCIKHGRENRIQVLLIKNLAASDLMMGVYMLIISSADAYYQQYFPSWSNNWRNGPLCTFAGTLSVLSSEASVFFITLISIDRFLAIKYNNRKWRLTKKSTLIVLMCLWSLVLLLSVLPVSFSGVNQKFYDVSEVCIGLPFVRAHRYFNKTFSAAVKIDGNVDITFRNITDYELNYTTDIGFEDTYTDVAEGNNPGLYFSIVLFLGINLVCFLFVAVIYAWIFIIVLQSNRRVGISRTDQEITLAKRMAAIVVTDFMCWAPIIVIGILVQAAIVTIHPVVYVYIVVFLLPINSALNPFIYTIAIIFSDYLTRSTKNKNIPAKNNIGLTKTANAENKREHAKKRKDIPNNRTENELKLASTAFSHHAKGETKSHAENDIGLTNNETENVPKMASTPFYQQPKSNTTETKSDAEIDIEIANNETENALQLTSISLPLTRNSPESETKSDAENDIGLTNNETENVSKMASTSFSQQPKNHETETKSDVEKNIGLAKNETENVSKMASSSFSPQPKSPETVNKSDAENDKGLAKNETENVPKMTPISLSQRPKIHEPETKSDTENVKGLANNETENVPKMTLTLLSQRPKSHEPETKSDAENDKGLANNETENVPKMTLTLLSQRPKSHEPETKSDAENDKGLVNNEIENLLEMTQTSLSQRPKSHEPETKSDAENDKGLANNET